MPELTLELCPAGRQKSWEEAGSLDNHGVQEWQGARGVGCEVTEELKGWEGGAELVVGGRREGTQVEVHGRKIFDPLCKTIML